jgi:hypothetical protein
VVFPKSSLSAMEVIPERNLPHSHGLQRPPKRKTFVHASRQQARLSVMGSTERCLKMRRENHMHPKASTDIKVFFEIQNFYPVYL